MTSMETNRYKHNPDLTPEARELRKHMSREERRLWYDFLREYPLRFLRKKVIDDHVVDFYCAKAHLVVMVTGLPAASLDEEETNLVSLRAALQRRKLRLLPVARQEIWRNFSNVCRCIDEEVTESLRQAPPDTSL